MAEGTPLPAYVLGASEGPSAGGSGLLEPKVWRPLAGVERSVVIEAGELDEEAEAVVGPGGVGERLLGAAGAARPATTVARDVGGDGAWIRQGPAARSRRTHHGWSASVGSTSRPGRPTPSTRSAARHGTRPTQLRRNLPGILARLLNEISEVLVESTDTELRLLTRTAFGFRWPEHLSALFLLGLGGPTADLTGRNAA